MFKLICKLDGKLTIKIHFLTWTTMFHHLYTSLLDCSGGLVFRVSASDVEGCGLDPW